MFFTRRSTANQLQVIEDLLETLNSNVVLLIQSTNLILSKLNISEVASLKFEPPEKEK